MKFINMLYYVNVIIIFDQSPQVETLGFGIELECSKTNIQVDPNFS